MFSSLAFFSALLFCAANFYILTPQWILIIFHIAGLLKVGVPQPWEKSKENINYVRQAGVRQFISHYKKVKDLNIDEFLWGDEVEYGMFHVDAKTKEIRLSLKAKEVCFVQFVICLFDTILFQSDVCFEVLIRQVLSGYILIIFTYEGDGNTRREGGLTRASHGDAVIGFQNMALG